MIERKSNFELMRIISMFMIIIYHIIVHGKLLENTTGTIYLCLIFIYSVCLVHVNSFIILSGYFNYNKRFKMNKVISLLNIAFFYSAFIVIIFQSLNLIDFNNVEVLKELSYIPFNEYWFIKNYIILYCLSPFINILIKNINRHEYKRLLLVLFIFFSIIPVITGNNTFSADYGFSLYSFIFMYFIGAYLSIYPIKKPKLFENLNRKRVQLVLITSFFVLGTVNLSLFFASNYMSSLNSNIFNEISVYLAKAFRSYCNPLVIFQTICYFLYFKSLNIKSKFINYIGKFVFGVYLIHDNNIVRQFLYKWLKIDIGTMIYSKSIIIKVFVSALIIYIVCTIIEILRYYLFKFVSSRKVIININNRLKEKI